MLDLINNGNSSLRFALLFVAAHVSAAMQETDLSDEENLYGRELKSKVWSRSRSYRDRDGGSNNLITELIITGVLVGIFCIAALIFFIVTKLKKSKKTLSDVE